MVLNWTAPVSGGAVTGYRIERAEDAATLAWTELVSDTGTAATVWSDSGLSAATVYHYRVTGAQCGRIGSRPVRRRRPGTTRPQVGLLAATAGLSGDGAGLAAGDGAGDPQLGGARRRW